MWDKTWMLQEGAGGKIYFCRSRTEKSVHAGLQYTVAFPQSGKMFLRTVRNGASCISTWAWYGIAQLQTVLGPEFSACLANWCHHICYQPHSGNETISVLAGPDQHEWEWLSKENGLVKTAEKGCVNIYIHIYLYVIYRQTIQTLYKSLTSKTT